MTVLKRMTLLVFCLTLILSMALPAAAEENLEIKGMHTTIRSGKAYHSTDLFDKSFKGVMPGDTITADIVISVGRATSWEDSVQLWLRTVSHDEKMNPLQYSETAEALDGNDQSGVAGQRDETVAGMMDFLNQLNLKVYNITNGNNKLIFSGKADQLDGLRSNVLLGTFQKVGKVYLRVQLEVPHSLDNKYAHRVGEIDWIFTVIGFDDPDVDNPKTGDFAHMLFYGVCMVTSGTMLFLLLGAKKKRRQG